MTPADTAERHRLWESRRSRRGQVAYTLILGQKNYSSWSMRAWLLLEALELPFDEVTIPLYRPDSHHAVRELGGQTGLVPVLVDDGTPLWDTPPCGRQIDWIAPVRAASVARCIPGFTRCAPPCQSIREPVDGRQFGLPR